MTIEIKVPMLPESVADAVVATWHKKEGDSVSRDENIVDLETDKVMLEVPSSVDGVIEKILVAEGDTVTADAVIAIVKEGAVAAPKQDAQPEAAAPAAKADTAKPATQQAAAAAPDNSKVVASPSVRRKAAEEGVDLNKVGGGRISSQDLAQYMQGGVARSEERVPMSRLRARVADRLKEVQNTAAILTTFNEVNMKPVMDLRKKYKDQFEKTHDTRLGFMSFFTKAAVEALKRFPAVNASIDGSDIVYHNFFDIGIAVGSPRGLVVPIVRDADQLSMAGVEARIREYAGLAKTGKIALEDMTGGTFTITNGGTYGSMLSTPILNAPQSAILGMHNIVERPVVENGEIVIRPMMYLALSYDHRIIDGKEAIGFLVTIKEMIEDPARLLLEV